MHWREDVFGLIRSGEHDRLHILTHPFWYADVQESMRDKLISFILSATADRRASVQSNFTALDEVIGKEGVAGNAL